jgi:hypothetical protein
MKGQKMPKFNYPYVRAWEQMMRSNEFYIEDQIALARKENAPEDAMWRGKSGKWHCFGEMMARNPNKSLIAAYLRGNEDETV